jgi:GH25 family lysozyme M1 (1,4-beta-N-acetylmuramidase)
VSATEGDDAIKAAELLRGAYHCFHPDTGAQAQADHFLSVMGPLGPDDLPATAAE